MLTTAPPDFDHPWWKRTPKSQAGHLYLFEQDLLYRPCQDSEFTTLIQTLDNGFIQGFNFQGALAFVRNISSNTLHLKNGGLIWVYELEDGLLMEQEKNANFFLLFEGIFSGNVRYLSDFF